MNSKSHLQHLPALRAPDDGAAADRRVLVAGIGPDHLRDMSVGLLLIERLRHRPWPPAVQLEELIAGAVIVLHRLWDAPCFDAAVFVAAEPRGDAPGTIRSYSWAMPPVTEAEVQARVADALMGIVSLETLLIVAGHFAGLPPRVQVIEVEPQDNGWGTRLSQPIAAVLERLERLVNEQVEELLA